MPEKHVQYGGSNADIWSSCPGYAQLAVQVPKRPVGTAAIEGTAQHKVMELLLEDPDKHPKDFLGSTVLGVEIRQDHVDALQIALDAYVEIVESFPENATLLSEQFVGLTGAGDEEVGGTMDAGAVHEHRAAIIDFKFGQIEVKADKKQNAFYAICARKSLPEFARVREVDSYIIQPAFDPAIDKVTYSSQLLDQMEQSFYAAIKISKTPNPDFLEGEWCTWCHAKLACPAKTQRLKTLVAPNHILDLADVAKNLEILRSWDKWREEAEERIQHELEHGTEVPGWKLVAKRAVRQWKDEAATTLRFRALRIPESKFMITKLVTPAAAEKLIPKSVVAELAQPVSSGNTIAPADDKRPAVLAPAAIGRALNRLR